MCRPGRIAALLPAVQLLLAGLRRKVLLCRLAHELCRVWPCSLGELPLVPRAPAHLLGLPCFLPVLDLTHGPAAPMPLPCTSVLLEYLSPGSPMPGLFSFLWSQLLCQRSQLFWLPCFGFKSPSREWQLQEGKCDPIPPVSTPVSDTVGVRSSCMTNTPDQVD